MQMPSSLRRTSPFILAAMVAFQGSTNAQDFSGVENAKTPHADPVPISFIRQTDTSKVLEKILKAGDLYNLYSRQLVGDPLETSKGQRPDEELSPLQKEEEAKWEAANEEYFRLMINGSIKANELMPMANGEQWTVSAQIIAATNRDNDRLIFDRLSKLQRTTGIPTTEPRPNFRRVAIVSRRGRHQTPLSLMQFIDHTATRVNQETGTSRIILSLRKIVLEINRFSDDFQLSGPDKRLALQLTTGKRPLPTPRARAAYTQ